MTRLPVTRTLRLFAAAALASCMLLYTGLWMAAVRISRPPAVELGYDDAYRPSDHSVLVRCWRGRGEIVA